MGPFEWEFAMVEDSQLVSATLQGEFYAFESLVEKYQGKIYRHLRKMVNDPLQAEDLLQETFLNVYRGLAGFSGAASFSTWLFRIATNSALMYLSVKDLKPWSTTTNFQRILRNS